MKSKAIFIRTAIIGLFLIALSISFFSSCTVQQELSNGFQKHNDSVSVLVVGSSMLQKTSAVIMRLYPQFDQLSPELQDTVWKHQTKFLDVAQDSLLLDLYYNTILEKLRKTGMKIYDDAHADEFIKQPGVKWIFRIGQLQLEEDKQKVDFSTELTGQEQLYKDMEIEVLSMNVWFEVFKSENDTTPLKVLYAEKKISDEVDGRFFSTGDNDQYEFRYKRTDIAKEDLPKLAKETAELNAQQIANFLFTQYIKLSYPESERYYGYDIERKKYYDPDEKSQFIEIK